MQNRSSGPTVVSGVITNTYCRTNWKKNIKYRQIYFQKQIKRKDRTYKSTSRQTDKFNISDSSSNKRGVLLRGRKIFRHILKYRSKFIDKRMQSVDIEVQKTHIICLAVYSESSLRGEPTSRGINLARKVKGLGQFGHNIRSFILKSF